jgi:diguanylate cyclase (GGDEF)-like protein
MRVLVADDDPVSRRVVEVSLRQEGHEPVLAEDGGDALRILQQPDSPRLAVLDWLMPSMSGLDVCRAIRSGAGEPYVYVLLLTGKDRHEEIVEGLDAGADDYLTKPCNLHELRARVRAGVRLLTLQDELVDARERLRVQATHDPLTGLLNRGAVFDILAKECARSKRTREAVTVIMVDVDHFKQINDTLGHLAGDDVLREIAVRLQTSVRTYDAVGRYGGEEFLIVAPGCPLGPARELAERLRATVCSSPIPAGPSEDVSVTISLGIACAAATSPDALLGIADRALYDAKASGRNRTVFAPTV